MSDWTVREVDGDRERTCDTRSEAEDIKADMEQLGLSVEVVPPGDTETDGGPEVVESDPREDTPTEPVPVESDSPDLPERSVSDDPLDWVPGEFVDTIDGTQAINRKGYEVLSHFYDISVNAEVQVGPEETDHEFARVKATAETPDGRTCTAHGSAHVDRDDDAHLLLEMADTRARKRALSIATGVGAVAVSELKSELQQ